MVINENKKHQDITILHIHINLYNKKDRNTFVDLGPNTPFFVVTIIGISIYGDGFKVPF